MNDKNINKNSNQSGRSMIEMLGVLAIVGVLSVGGIAGYSKAMEKFKTNQLLNDIAHLVVDVQNISLNQNEPKYGWVWNRDASNILGTYKAFDFDKDKHIFGGFFEIRTEAKDDVTYGTAFSLNLMNLPLTPCIELLTTDWGASNSKFLKLSAGYSPTTMGYTEDPCTSENIDKQYFRCSSQNPLSVSLAAKACKKILNQEYDGIKLIFE